MTLEEFRKRFAPRVVRAGGLVWRVIESKPRKSAQAPRLLMLPGTLGTAEIFWNQIAALAGKAHVVSVTYPQIGEIERLADGLAALCDRLGLDRASVVGSSLGGYLAQIFAARHPDRVETLFIGNSLSDPSGPHPSGMSAAQLRRRPGAFHRDMILRSVRSWPEPTPAYAALRELLLYSGTRLLSARALKARVLAVRCGPAVPKLALPDRRIVIIDCADDPLIPKATQDDVRRRYPGARKVRMRRGGHYPYVLQPDAYLAELRRGLGLG